MEVSDTLVRAARELLRWDQQRLASKAGVGLATLRRFETGTHIQSEKIAAIVAALQEAGVAFIGPDEGFKNVREGVLLTSSSEPLPRPVPRVYRPRAAAKPSKGAASNTGQRGRRPKSKA